MAAAPVIKETPPLDQVAALVVVVVEQPTTAALDIQPQHLAAPVADRH